jgi:2-polyprenyl-3-methyl-5-hydroxy-6-metoxy-1,4-benzoquinol methylase
MGLCEMSLPICCLCSSRNITKIQSHVRDIPNVSVLKCDACGLVFLSSFSHITEHYYESGKMHDWDQEKWEGWVAETQTDTDRRVSYFARKVYGCNVLDYGCGNGSFVMKVARFAKSVVGVEPDETYKQYIGEGLDKKGIHIYRSIADVPSQKFDLITMFHVVEHLTEPEIILNALAERLADGGLLIIETPNSDDALLSLYACKAFSDFTYWGCHIRLYNEASLQLLLKNAGLEGDIVQIQRYPVSNHLYWLSCGKPGGDKIWEFMNTPELNRLYERKLSEKKMCDTLFGVFYR